MLELKQERLFNIAYLQQQHFVTPHHVDVLHRSGVGAGAGVGAGVGVGVGLGLGLGVGLGPGPGLRLGSGLGLGSRPACSSACMTSICPLEAAACSSESRVAASLQPGAAPASSSTRSTCEAQG